MATIKHTRQGFVFVNELGQYAILSTPVSHGPSREVVMWVDDINQAYVFLHDAMSRRKYKVLEKCQSLKAVVTREVLIKNWEV